MRLRRIVQGVVFALVLLTVHSHAEDDNGSAHASELRTAEASSTSDGSSGSATPATTPLVTSAPTGDADAGDETPTPTPSPSPKPTAAMATTESTTETPSPTAVGGRGRTQPQSPTPSQSPKENVSTVTEAPPPAPGPTPSPSEGTTLAPTPVPEPDTATPPPSRTPDVDNMGDVTDTSTPQVTTEAPESPPPPVAMVPPGLVQPSPVTADTESPPETTPVPDEGSPSPPRPPQVYTNPPTVANENREASTSTDAHQTPVSPAKTTDSTLSSPVATVEVTVKDDSAAVETTPRPKAYRRGDNVIVVQKDLGDGTTVDVEVVVSPAEAPAVLVRNGNTQSSGSSGSAANDVFSKLVRVVMSILASLVVLVVFHFFALQSSWTSSLSVLARPNQWELLVFITYVQAMASTAQYVVRYAPASLWKFVDAFSWTVFIPFHHSNSGVSTSSTGRRLTDLVVLDGVVAFADRIGVDETSLLQTSAAGFVISCGMVAVLVGVAVSVIKYKSRTSTKDARDPLTLGSVHGVVSVFRPDSGQMPPMYIAYGATVVFGVFALYPVTLMTTFEIASQVRADQISGSSLAISLLLIAAVPVALVVRSIPALALIPSEDVYKTNWRHRALWGILSSSECVKYGQRVPMAVAWLAMQLASAVIVGAVVSDVWQILLLLAVDFVFVTVVLTLRPFAAGHRLATIFTVAVGVLKAVNYSLAFMFVSASSHHNATATAFIVLNSLVITLWFVRLTAIAVRVVNRATNPEPLVREHASLSLDAAYESSLFVALPTTRDGHHGPRQAML